MLQDQTKRKRKAPPRSKPSGETDINLEIPEVDETLNEVDEAIRKSEAMLKKPEEEVVVVIKQNTISNSCICR